MKSLKKAREENLGKKLRSFEATDSIFHRIRSKTHEGIEKIEDYARSRAPSLYYERKAELYMLVKENAREQERL